VYDLGKMKEKLTFLQYKTLKEIRRIIDLSGLDYENIRDVDKNARTPVLHNIKDQIVRSEVIMEYTIIDEFLNSMIANYYFGKSKTFIQLWKTKRFKLFNYYILEELSLLKKLSLCKEIKKIPKSIVEKITKINALRNGLAHAFFPQNLKRSKPIYRGKDIFTPEGFELFGEDAEKIHKFFFKLLF